MIIENFETVLIRIPFDHGATQRSLSGRDWPSLDYVFIRLDTDAGISGWGDAFAYNAAEAVKAAIDHTVAPALIGQDARDIAAIADRLQRDNHLWGRYGLTMFAISGIDIALWDLAGKAAGKPLHELLGGKRRDKLPGYASLFKYADPEIVAAKCGDARAEGYDAIKLHETGVAETAAARVASGDGINIMLDTNCPWTPAEAAAMARQLKEYDLHWLEEPIFPPEDFKALARLGKDSGIAIAAGENACTAMEFEKMFEAGAVTYAQPSVTKVGGISEMMKIAAMAPAHGVQVMPHCPYIGSGFLATLHVAAAMEQDSLVERFYLTPEASPIGDFIDAKDGHFRIPDAPGLGRDPLPEVLRDYRS